MCRPAGNQTLDADSALVGIPAYVRAGTTLGDKYYFVEVTDVRLSSVLSFPLEKFCWIRFEIGFFWAVNIEIPSLVSRDWARAKICEVPVGTYFLKFFSLDWFSFLKCHITII